MESASVDLFVLGDGKRRYRLASFLMFFSLVLVEVGDCGVHMFVCLFVCCCC